MIIVCYAILPIIPQDFALSLYPSPTGEGLISPLLPWEKGLGDEGFSMGLCPLPFMSVGKSLSHGRGTCSPLLPWEKGLGDEGFSVGKL